MSAIGVFSSSWDPESAAYTSIANSRNRASTNPAGLVFSIGRIEMQDLPGGVAIRALGGDLPLWVIPTVRALNRILRLGDNWDSYGARRVRFDSVKGALELLVSVMRDETPAPTVVPTNQGHVQLEWHRRGVDLEIEVESHLRSRVFFDAADGSWENELSFDLTELSRAVRQISG